MPKLPFDWPNPGSKYCFFHPLYVIGAFLIPYFLMLLLIGLPLFYMELAFGQYASLGAITIWKVAPLFKGMWYSRPALCLYQANFSFYWFVSVAFLDPHIQAVLKIGLCCGEFAAVDFASVKGSNVHGHQTYHSILYMSDLLICPKSAGEVGLDRDTKQVIFIILFHIFHTRYQ